MCLALMTRNTENGAKEGGYIISLRGLFRSCAARVVGTSLDKLIVAGTAPQVGAWESVCGGHVKLARVGPWKTVCVWHVK